MARRKGKRGKKGEQAAPAQERDTASYYQLKTRAVNDLVTADTTNSPEVSEEELRKYGARGRHPIPGWVKVFFVKFWFAAAICYFFIWGLGGYLQTLIDQLFVIGVALGIVTDLLTNNAIRFFAPTEGAHDKWMMFPRKRYATFVWNILYAFVIAFVVYTIYSMINLAAMRVTGDRERLALGVEPILFGVFCTAADVGLVTGKRMLQRIIREAKNGARLEQS